MIEEQRQKSTKLIIVGMKFQTTGRISFIALNNL